jgi:uncharacterized protein YbjT (DUF2867 family)
MVVLVVGATGELGGRVAELLRARGEVVRRMVRTAAPDPDSVHGDLANPDSLSGACVGVKTVVATASALSARLAGDRHSSILKVDQLGMSALVDAAEQAGVERFVYVSFAGLDVGPDSPLGRAKQAIEHRLAASSLRSVVLRPDGFQEVQLRPLGRFDLAARKVAIIGRGDTSRRLVSTDDVAALVAAVVAEPDPPTVIEFGGPELISRNQLVAVAEELIGQPIKRQYMPRAAARLGAKLLSRPNDALASVFASGLAMDLVPAHWDDSALVERGITPRSATDYLTTQAAAANAEGDDRHGG